MNCAADAAEAVPGPRNGGWSDTASAAANYRSGPMASGQVREAVAIALMASSNTALNCAGLWAVLSPSVRAREKLAITPWLRASRVVAWARV